MHFRRVVYLIYLDEPKVGLTSIEFIKIYFRLELRRALLFLEFQTRNKPKLFLSTKGYPQMPRIYLQIHNGV